MAEAMYGINTKLKDKAISKLDKEMANIINKAYKNKVK